MAAGADRRGPADDRPGGAPRSTAAADGASAAARRQRITLVPTGQPVLARALAGDADAFAALVREHQATAFRAACLVTGSAAEAEDAAQEGFVKAWRALPRFDSGRPFRPWLIAIVVNEARNRRRHAGRQAALALRALDPAEEALDERVARHAEHARLVRLVASMREEDRLAIGCRYFLDLSEEETAQALGWPRGTVKSRLSRALDRLRAEMEADG